MMFEKQIELYDQTAQAYIEALRQIRTEHTDEHLVAFFFKKATGQMLEDIAQKQQASRPMFFF